MGQWSEVRGQGTEVTGHRSGHMSDKSAKTVESVKSIKTRPLFELIVKVKDNLILTIIQKPTFEQ